MKLLSVAACLATGCVSVSHVQPADTIGKRHFQIGVESAVQRVASPYLPYYPRYDTTFRYGLNDTTDVGVRAGYSGLEGHAKFLLTEPGDPGLAISVLPAIGGGFFPGSSGNVGIVNTSVTMLAGLKHHHGNELVGGVRLGSRVMVAPDHDGDLEVGISVGYNVRIGERFGLMPELALAVPVVESRGAPANLGTPSKYAGDAMPFSDMFIVQLNLAVSFGRQRAGE